MSMLHYTPHKPPEGRSWSTLNLMTALKMSHIDLIDTAFAYLSHGLCFSLINLSIYMKILEREITQISEKRGRVPIK
jgi:hypothetical protein